MKYQEYILKKNESNSSRKISYDKIQLSRDEKFQHPFTILFLKESLPIKIINGVNRKNEREVYKELNQFLFLREISKDEFEKNKFLAGKISALGVNAINEKEFITEIPISHGIQNENRRLIEKKEINVQDAINDLVQNSDFAVIENEEQFDELLKEDKAVLYIQIDWSGVERIGRVKIVEALSKAYFDELPKYLINNSTQKYQFFNNYIRKCNDGIGQLVTRGSGEILLLKKGEIVDYIEAGFMINEKNLIEILRNWITSNK